MSYFSFKKTSIPFFLLVKTKTTEIIFSYLVVFTCLVFVFINFSKYIEGNLPYIGHWDEPYLTIPASNMIKKNELKPSHFYYPALPMYITALGMVFGYFTDATNNTVYSPDALGRYDFPFHERENVILYAKYEFLLLSILSVFFVSALLQKVSGSALIMTFVVPAALCSQTFVIQSKTYINVDIVATFFSLFGLFYALSIRKICYSSSTLYGKVVPAILSAFAISSKYNYFPIVFVFIYMTIKYDKNWKEGCVWFLALVFLIFIGLNPYIIIDIKGFLYYTAIQMSAYNNGYPGAEGDPGWGQLIFHLKPIISEFSFVFVACTVVGILYSVKINLENSIAIFLFVIPYCLLLINQRMHYLRNFLPVYMLLIVFCGTGIIFAYRLLCKITPKEPASAYKYIKFIPTIACIVTACLCLNLQSLKMALSQGIDTRNKLSMTIKSNIPTATPIMISKDIGFADTAFHGYNVINVFRPELHDTSHFISQMQSGAFLVIPRYEYCSKHDGQQDDEAINRNFEASSLINVLTMPGTPFCVDSQKPISIHSPALILYYKK